MTDSEKLASLVAENERLRADITYLRQERESQRERADTLRTQLAEARDLLQECLNWHRGDKWREGNSMERASWEKHEAVLQAALTPKEPT